MIKFENTEVTGWEHAIRGCRNPYNSWEKLDSRWDCDDDLIKKGYTKIDTNFDEPLYFYVGPNDYDLMMRLRNTGTDHRKFMRMIVVYVDITAPLYWWKEFDTYKVGTVANSCSTMHKITDKKFTLDDFSCEHLLWYGKNALIDTINELNYWRNLYIHGGSALVDDCHEREFGPKSKEIWWQMIQLLPSSYNQKRTVMLNYEVLANIYKSRKNHKLDEWSKGFCDWILTLPYSELITG